MNLIGIHDSRIENHMQPDSVSGCRVLGLAATKEITLDGQKLTDAPPLTKPSSKK